MSIGLHWTGCELEPRFVELGNAQHRQMAARPRHAQRHAVARRGYLLQGDSRRLLEVVGGGMGAAVSSPPFGDQNDHERPLDSTRNKNGRHTISLPYGDTAGNIGIPRRRRRRATLAAVSPRPTPMQSTAQARGRAHAMTRFITTATTHSRPVAITATAQRRATWAICAMGDLRGL
jgi:hypothetical protein